MIVAPLSEIAAQAELSANMKTALDWLLNLGDKELEAGRHVIDGDKVFALVQYYETRENSDFWEGHKKYMDFQYLREGREMIGWAPLELATVTKEYDAERDMWMGSVPDGQWTPVLLQGGYLMILRPSDAHAPMRAAGASSPVKKIVVKVAVED